MEFVTLFATERTKKRSHHKPKPIGPRPRLGPGSGRSGGARGATHYSRHVKWVPPGTKPADCYICQLGSWRKARRLQKSAFFDPNSDPVLRQFPCLPGDVAALFYGDPDDYVNEYRYWSVPEPDTRFLYRWKVLTDETKYRFLRFAIYVNGIIEADRARVSAEREAARVLIKSNLTDVEI